MAKYLGAKPGGGGGAVSSVFGRIGAVVALAGDYVASLIGNDSSVSGASVADALNTLNSKITRVIGYLRLANILQTVTVPTGATPNIMLVVPAIIADFSLLSNGSLTLAANGVITYTGPNVQVLLKQTICTFVNGLLGFIVSSTAVNGDLVGQSADNVNPALVAAGAGMNSTAGAGGSINTIVSSRLVSLVSGDTIQPVVGTLPGAGGSDTDLCYYELEIFAIGAPLT